MFIVYMKISEKAHFGACIEEAMPKTPPIKSVLYTKIIGDSLMLERWLECFIENLAKNKTTENRTLNGLIEK